MVRAFPEVLQPDGKHVAWSVRQCRIDLLDDVQRTIIGNLLPVFLMCLF